MTTSAPFRTKIFGAGSIGNHLGNAARSLGWAVDLCDVDPAALERTRTQIYPGRYGQWDPEIRLFRVEDAPRERYDLVVVGTPPDSHVAVALAALAESPRALLIEKPLCTPDLAGVEDLRARARAQRVPVFVGYDHVVAKVTREAEALAAAPGLGPIVGLDVEFREHWAGIFAAHPWLEGPGDSYLGHWRRGGGALGEHSHALNLWQHFARLLGQGRVVEVSATADYVADGSVDYDRTSALTLRTEKGLIGRVLQDVVTNPPRKVALIQGASGYVELEIAARPGVDRVRRRLEHGDSREQWIEKTRRDDFLWELDHIRRSLEADVRDDVLSLERGLDTMLVIAAAHRSAREGSTITIDHNAGYRAEALAPRA